MRVISAQGETLGKEDDTGRCALKERVMTHSFRMQKTEIPDPQGFTLGSYDSAPSGLAENLTALPCQGFFP